jgi:hypothetical protein
MAGNVTHKKQSELDRDRPSRQQNLFCVECLRPFIITVLYQDQLNNFPEVGIDRIVLMVVKLTLPKERKGEM